MPKKEIPDDEPMETAILEILEADMADSIDSDVDLVTSKDNIIGDTIYPDMFIEDADWLKRNQLDKQRADEIEERVNINDPIGRDLEYRNTYFLFKRIKEQMDKEGEHGGGT
jgi:hypothetical protein